MSSLVYTLVVLSMVILIDGWGHDSLDFDTFSRYTIGPSEKKACKLCGCVGGPSLPIDEVFDGQNGYRDFEGFMCYNCQPKCPEKALKSPIWTKPLGNVLTLYQIKWQVDGKEKDVIVGTDRRALHTKERNVMSYCRTSENNDGHIQIGYSIKLFYDKIPQIPIGFHLGTLFPDLPSTYDQTTEDVIVPEYSDAKIKDRIFSQYKSSHHGIVQYLFHPRDTRLTSNPTETISQALERHVQGTMLNKPLIRLFQLTKFKALERKITITVDVVCRRRTAIEYSSILMKVKLMLKRYAIYGKNYRSMALKELVKQLNKSVIKAFQTNLMEDSTRITQKKKCYQFLIAKYYNRLREDLQLTIDGFIPDIGIHHSRLLDAFSSIDDPNKISQTPGIETDIEKANEEATRLLLKDFYGY